MTSKKFFTHPLGILVSALLATFLWGSAIPLIKLSYAELAIGSSEIYKQLLFAGYRFFGAGILIMLLMLVMGKKVSYQRGTWKGICTIALFQTFLQYVVFYIALSYSTGIQGAIISGTTSFFQIAVAHFMYKNDHFSLRKVIGLTLGFAAVIVVNLGKGEFQLDFGIGAWLLLAAAFFGAFGNVLSKNVSQKMELMYMTSYQMMLGGIGLTIVGALHAGFAPFTFSLKSLGMLLFLMFVSAAAFVLWNSVMKYNLVGKVSMYLFLIPVSGVILSSLMLNEQLSLIVILALFLVAAGIIIVNREGASKVVKKQVSAKDEIVTE